MPRTLGRKNNDQVFAQYAKDNKALVLLGFKATIAYTYNARINAPEVQWPSY